MPGHPLLHSPGMRCSTQAMHFTASDHFPVSPSAAGRTSGLWMGKREEQVQQMEKEWQDYKVRSVPSVQTCLHARACMIRILALRKV